MSSPRPTPAAGGFFLVVAILAGFGLGLSHGRALEGSVIGLAVGTIIAVAVWLIDRSRARR